MDARRIRPLFLPPHPRRNQYIPASSEETRFISFPRFAKVPRKLHIRSFLLPLKIKGKPLILLWRNDSIGQLAAHSAKTTTGGSILPFKIGPASLGSDFVKEQRCHILSKTKDKLSFL